MPKKRKLKPLRPPTDMERAVPAKMFDPLLTQIMLKDIERISYDYDARKMQLFFKDRGPLMYHGCSEALINMFRDAVGVDDTWGDYHERKRIEALPEEEEIILPPKPLTKEDRADILSAHLERLKSLQNGYNA